MGFSKRLPVSKDLCNKGLLCRSLYGKIFQPRPQALSVSKRLQQRKHRRGIATSKQNSVPGRQFNQKLYTFCLFCGGSGLWAQWQDAHLQVEAAKPKLLGFPHAGLKGSGLRFTTCLALRGIKIDILTATVHACT